MLEVVDIAVKLVHDALVPSSPGTVKIVDLCIDELREQLASTRVEVASLTVKLSILRHARNKAEIEEVDLMRSIRTETESSEDHTIAKRSGVLSRNDGVLQSVQGIVKASDDLNASHNNTLT